MPDRLGDALIWAACKPLAVLTALSAVVVTSALLLLVTEADDALEHL